MAYQSSKGKEKPQKLWHIEAHSTDGVVVTLGRYETKESADADSKRIVEDAFYSKVKIIHTPPPPSEEGDEEKEDGAAAK